MTQLHALQSLAPSKAQKPDLPLELISLAPEEIPQRDLLTDAVPPPPLEQWEDRDYPEHWGINE